MVMSRLFGTDTLLYGVQWTTESARVRRPLCVGRSGLLLGWWIQVWLEIRIVPAGLDAHPPIKKKWFGVVWSTFSYEHISSAN